MEKTTVTKDLENKTLTIERVFNTTKDRVWPFYAEQAMFEQWWGPEGWSTTTKEFNFTVGGRIHYDMKCMDEAQGEWFGKSSWGLMVIESIDEPNKLVYMDYFSDESGVIDESMPSQRVELSLVEEGETTRMVIQTFYDNAEQIEQLLEMGMIEGFDGQMNKLDVLLT